MTAATISPARSSAMEMQKWGRPCRKLVVPSSGIDDPAMLAVAAFAGAAFFHQEAVIGPGARKFLAQHLLGLGIGGGDEIARPLYRDLQLFDLAEVALQPARRLVGGPGHHIDKGGAGRHGGVVALVPGAFDIAGIGGVDHDARAVLDMRAAP